MAMICKCCGKKIGVLGGNKLSDSYDEPICDKCFTKFNVKLNIFRNSRDIGDLNTRENDLLKTLDGCDFPSEGKNYILSYINAKKAEIKDELLKASNQQMEEDILRKENEIREMQLRENIKNHTLTTGYSFENYCITAYLGVISGSVVLGTGFISEFGASISDMFGKQSDLFSDKLEQARELALIKLKEESANLGGNAIIGIDFDYITFSNNMIGVVANGTSVIIGKEE